MLIDLVAGDAREILLAIAVDDRDTFDDRRRFDAHLALDAGDDLDWLDLFAAAARDATGRSTPAALSDSMQAPRGLPSAATERDVARVEGAWVSAVGAVPHDLLGAVAGRWVELLGSEGYAAGEPDEAVFEAVARELVAFCRAASAAEDVLLAWSI
jgi:hypothetical protein